ETLWAFSGDGRLLASASNDLSLWHVESGRLLATLAQPSWITALAFAASGRRLATGHDDGGVRVWDLTHGALTGDLAGHDQPISAVVFSPDGRRLASAGEDRVLRLW